MKFVRPVALLTLLVSAAVAAPADKIALFVAGPPSHGPGEHRFPEGCALLAAALSASGLPIRGETNLGWPDDAALGAADTLVIYSDGLEAHVAAGREAALRRHCEEGKGLVVIHFALEPVPGTLADILLDAVGGRFESQLSVNPVWVLRKPLLASHAVTRGVPPFEIEDEWYFHLRFRPEAVPVLQGVPPVTTLGADGPRSGNPAVRAALARGEPQTLAWVHEREGRRAFGITGGHYHHNWNHDGFRRLVLNAVVWTARLPVPDGGVPFVGAPTARYPTIDEAIARGDIDDVRLHLQVDPQRVHRRPGVALSPLHQAILRNRTEIALMLLERGADPDQPDRSRRTPLHLATERGNPAVIRALLSRGARPNERDQIGWTPLHHAAAKDRVAVARELLAGGANPMTLSERGGTPLHEAAASGSAEMVELLLEHGVDPTVVSNTGVTALDVAREYKNEPAIARLSRPGHREDGRTGADK